MHKATRVVNDLVKISNYLFLANWIEMVVLGLPPMVLMVWSFRIPLYWKMPSSADFQTLHCWQNLIAD